MYNNGILRELRQLYSSSDIPQVNFFFITPDVNT